MASVNEDEDGPGGFTCANCRRGRCARCNDQDCACCAGGDPDPWP